MKIYLVSDNRTGSNWGCRATSIALRDYLNRRHKVVGVLYNTVKKKVAKLDFMQGSVEQASSELLKRAFSTPEMNEALDRLDSCDAVVINGEGDMIFDPERKTLTFLLAMIKIAHAAGKKVFYVNAMVSDSPVVGRDPIVLKQCLESLRLCDGIALRDKTSCEIIKEADPTLPAVLAPDALFQWGERVRKCASAVREDGDIILPLGWERSFGRYDFSGDYVCIGGSSNTRGASVNELVSFYLNLIKRLAQAKVPLYLVEASARDSYLRSVSKLAKVPLIPLETPILLAAQVMANARVFISGRYHPSVLASLGGTPCVGMVSNSHKMGSLQDLLGYESPREYLFNSESSNIGEIAAAAEHLLTGGEAVRSKIRRRSRAASRLFRYRMDRMLPAFSEEQAPKRR